MRANLEVTADTLGAAVERLANQSERSARALRSLRPYLRDHFSGLDTNNQEAVLVVLIAANKFGSGNVLEYLETLVHGAHADWIRRNREKVEVQP